MEQTNHNQDKNFYSKDYFLKGCAGSEFFEPGKESHHSLYDYIFKVAGSLEGKKILDIGCGRGELCLSSIRRGAAKALGVDFSPDAIEISLKNRDHSDDIEKNKVNFICADAIELDLNEKFDFIFLTDVVEHLYDDQNKKLFKNLSRFLSSDGILLVHTMPTREFIMYGQFFKFILYLFKGKRYHPETFESQARVTHVNLQSSSTFKKMLSDFEVDVWYDFGSTSFLRSLISKTPLVRIFSSNLWAKVRPRK